MKTAMKLSIGGQPSIKCFKACDVWPVTYGKHVMFGRPPMESFIAIFIKLSIATDDL